jgi:RHS repeat-associated protein
VVLLRGRLRAAADERLPDSSEDCRRNGEAAACGAYFPVTDHIGKPVLMLDWAGRVAGAADYDPFGHINRVTHHAGTAHPYPDSQSQVLATFSQPPENERVRVRMRPRFSLVETEQGADLAEWVEVDTGSTLGNVSGAWPGRVIPPWVEPAMGRLSVRFTAGPMAQRPACDAEEPPMASAVSSTAEGAATPGDCQCTSEPCCCDEEPVPTPNANTGIVMEGYEYQRFQVGAQPFWTPLRFPGQYHDAETDLFENWNRYYDSHIGGYLQPEPMLQNPQAVLAAAMQGDSLPAYAYALSNPINFTDATGNMPDSIRLRTLAMIAQGDIAGAGRYYLLATGASQLPRWFQMMQNAFGAANRVAGPCQQVAKDIYSGFGHLGAKPEYLRIASTEGQFLSWQGRTMVSNNNVHVAVRHGKRIYDAFTGPAGMTEAEYIAAMMHEGQLLFTVITSP